MPNPLVTISPTARAVSFDNTSTPFTATNVRDAIVQSTELATGKTRFDFNATYGGNANVGRHLEIAPSIGSDVMQFFVPISSEIVRLSLQSVDTSGNFTVGIFKSTDTVNPITTVSLLAGVSDISIAVSSVPLSITDRILVKVTVGTRTKPYCRVWMAAI